jgi:di/tricarboxylate transporter
MNEKTNKRTSVVFVTAVLIAVALLAWFWASTHQPGHQPFLTESRPPPPRTVPGDIELYYTLNTVFSTLNAALLVALLVLYVNMYVRRKVEFTLLLAIFCSVLLLNALSSNPMLQWAFGFSAFGLGPFAMLPDVFTFAALTILLYLTLKY